MRRLFREFVSSAKDIGKIVVQDYFLAISLDQELVIKNYRLGIMYKVIQAITLLSLAVYVVQAEIWRTKVRPVPYGLTAWPEDIPFESKYGPDDGMKHCSDAGSYDFDFNNNTVFRPKGCGVLELGDGWVKEGNRIMIFTYVDDVDEVRSTNRTNDCTSPLCKPLGPNVPGCLCQKHREYFVKNAEKASIHFLHGYSAKKPDGQKDQRTLTSNVDTTGEEPDMTTFFRDGKGEPCTINGKTSFERAEIDANGIYATIEDWMKCADVHMDTNPREFGYTGEGVTHLRLMGFRLTFEIFYTNWNTGAVTCYVSPRVSPIWTSAFGFGKSYNDISLSNAYHTRTRLAHGVQIEFEIKGDLRYWSLHYFVNGVVNVLFLMSIPRSVMQFLCLYCMGSLSHIYRNAKRTRFSLKEQIRTALARALMPMMIFRGLIGGQYNRRAELLNEIAAEDLKQHIQDMFADELANGTLQDRHINRMVMMVCEGPDKKLKEHMTYKDFERICNCNDVITEDILVQMLHWDRRKWLLERVLDNTDMTLDAHVQEVITTQSSQELGDATTLMVQQPSYNTERVAKLHAVMNEVKALEKRTLQVEEAAHQTHRGMEEALSKAAGAHERAELVELMAKQRAQTAADLHEGKEAPQHDVEIANKDMQQEYAARVLAAEKAANKALEDAHAAYYRMEALADNVRVANEKLANPSDGGSTAEPPGETPKALGNC